MSGRINNAWFKKFPQTERSAPNAQFIRSVGVLNGEEVCEIFWCGEHWKVRRSEIFVGDEAFAEAAKKMSGLIESKREPGQSREELARRCGISISTLRKRMAFIHNHLEK